METMCLCMRCVSETRGAGHAVDAWAGLGTRNTHIGKKFGEIPGRVMAQFGPYIAPPLPYLTTKTTYITIII